MTQPYRILVVDNSSHVRQSLDMLLTAQGYQVFVADNPVEARRLLRKGRVHLAVVDIRLEDDDDPQDVSGLELAASLDSIVARIVITGYDSHENMRRALRPILPDNIPANDYILKRDGPAVLLEAVERVCRDEIDVNWDLELEWQTSSAQDIGAEIELDQADLPHEVLADEVKELLRRLFYETDHIIVSRLLPSTQDGASAQSGAVLLRVRPHYRRGGWGAPVVCKIGQRRHIQIEADNYMRHVKGFIGGNRRTNLDQVKCTHHLGGILYSMLGITLDAIRDFQSFYHQANVIEIEQALTSLFKDICRYWYAGSRPSERINLTPLYRDALRLTDEKLQHMLTQYFPRQQGQAIQFEGLPGAFTNPIHWARDKELESFTCRCVTHGDLHGHNIFVDEHQQVWLIDFGRTGEGHALRDFIELETDIKFSLVKTVDLATLYHFEAALLQPGRLDDLLTLPEQASHPDIQKGFQVITILRRMAASVANDGDTLPYYQGLFYQTLNVARLRKVNKRQHALLSAALICERLDAW